LAELHLLKKRAEMASLCDQGELASVELAISSASSAAGSSRDVAGGHSDGASLKLKDITADL
jgi:hypothetical protein